MHEQLIRLLWGGFPDSLKHLGDQVLSAEGKPLQEHLAILTRIESEPGLPVHLFGLVASAKRALATQKEEDIRAFTERALKSAGLL